MSKLIDLTGMHFGNWTVLRKSQTKNNKTYWLCKCDCGTEKDVVAYTLKNGLSESCGCLSKLIKVEVNTKHGKYNHKLYGIWMGIKQRCYNVKRENYNRYGGRGIIMCEEWLNDFKTFYDWAMKSGYSDGLSIDRINNDGNYEPNNCRWATMKEQSYNKRTNRLIEYRGEIKTVTEWCNILNLNSNFVFNRLHSGYSIDSIFENKM